MSKNTKIGFKISNVFVGDLKTGDSKYPMLTIISEESRKLTYLKLPQLWNQQSFLDYNKWAWKTISSATAKQRRKDHNYNNIGDRIQQIKLSNPVQSISKSYEHGLSKHEEHQVKKTTSYCFNENLLQPLKRPKWLKTSRRHLSYLKITLQCIFEDLTSGEIVRNTILHPNKWSSVFKKFVIN